jgi:hypothetical protein
MRVTCNADAVPAAAAIEIQRDGVRACTGDQLVFAYDVDPTRGRDFRQALVIDTNGFARIRHLDGDAPRRTNPDCTDTTQEDCFGTSMKLPPGLILVDRVGERFFLSSQVRRMNLLTAKSDDGVLQLEMRGRPADRGSAFDPDTAPVAVKWLLTLRPPRNRRTIATIGVAATFRDDVQLSEARAANAEAFRAAELSSSNVDADHTTGGTRTHDADELRLLSSTGEVLEDVDANAAPRNCLLLPSDGSDGCPELPEGTAVDGRLELNQRAEAPTNGDPPNLRVSILPADGAPEYRGQSFITLDDTTSEQSDNFGAWIDRTVPGGEIDAGTRFEWTFRVVATD